MSRLAEDLGRAIERHGDRIAVEECGRAYSYRELAAAAASLIDRLATADPSGRPVAIIADHSFAGYAAVLAALVSGRTYVPLKPDFPAERVRYILELARCRTFVADDALYLRHGAALSGLARVEPVADGSANSLLPCAEADPVAYYMFTSGSTGLPKGVIVRHANVSAFLAAISQIVRVEPCDRCTQFFELSFDPSVHDMLVTFLAGASLVVDARRQRIDPVGFARAAGVTVWYSVPSILAMARRFRSLKPGALPGIRLAMFAGEALPVDLARAWVDTTPNTRNFNIYGPTEATITITWHEFDRESLAGYTAASVPIGIANPGGAVRVEGAGPRGAGEGELVLGGPQVAEGYLGDPGQTAERFEIDAAGGRWYHTGDLVTRDDEGVLTYAGRLDEQVKIDGYRIELGEIEAVLRDILGEGEVAVVDYPAGDTTALGALVAGCAPEPAALRERMIARLPAFMIPRAVRLADAIPLNANGKIDRKALRAVFLAGD